MALYIKNLYVGQLTNISQSTLYTVPANRACIVKNMRFVNTDTTARTVNAYYKPASGTARLITPSNMSLASGAVAIEDNEVTLAAGDLILGDASVANKIDCVISGIERDA